jgi:platelet-activating factor acetylhydrolase
MMDIELPAHQPRHFSEIKREGRYLLELETVLFTVFYPSALGSGTGVSPEGQEKWGRVTWLPRPRVKVAKGYGKFAGIPGFLITSFFGELVPGERDIR